MRHRLWLLVALPAAVAPLAAGCKPNLGSPASLTNKPRFLALRGTPPEASESSGIPVTYDALVVDFDNTVVPPIISTFASPPISWAQCLQPDPPANGNDVSSACLPGQLNADGGVITPDDPTSPPAPTYTATLPSNACTLFGPETPPPVKGQPPTRPADPDTTGGFYQPIRATWAGEVAFALERITCNLANAPSAIATQYAMDYVPNNNPVLADLVLDPANTAVPLYTAGQTAPPAPAMIAPNQPITLQADFSADSAESFLVWNVVTLTLDTQRESLRVSWFATGGAFAHDVTGRSQTETETFTQNVWTAPDTPGAVVNLWAVLRDDRGGVDFAAAQIVVTQ